MSDSPVHQTVGNVAKVPVNVIVRVLDLALSVLNAATSFVTGLVNDVSGPFRGTTPS